MKKSQLLWTLQAHSQAHQSHLLSCPAYSSSHHLMLLILDSHKRIDHMLPRFPCLCWQISLQKISHHQSHPNAHVQESQCKWNPNRFWHVWEEIRTEHCEQHGFSYSLKSLAAHPLLFISLDCCNLFPSASFLFFSLTAFCCSSDSLTQTVTCLHSITLVLPCQLYHM